MTDACALIATAHYLIGRKHIPFIEDAKFFPYCPMSRDTRSFATYIPSWINVFYTGTVTHSLTVTGMQSFIS